MVEILIENIALVCICIYSEMCFIICMLKKIFNIVAVGVVTATVFAGVFVSGYHWGPTVAEAFTDQQHNKIELSSKITMDRNFPQLAPLLNCPSFFLGEEFERNYPDARQEQAVLALEDRYRDLDRLQKDYHSDFNGALCKDLAYLDVIRENGLNGWEYELHKDFQENFVPEAEYSRWEKERFEIAFQNILENPVVLEAYAQWEPQSYFVNEQEATEQYNLRLSGLQAISDETRAAFGYVPAEIRLYVFSEEESPFWKNAGWFLSGGNNREEDVIAINYNPKYGVTDTFERSLFVLMHEVKHSIDDTMIRDFYNGAMQSDDIRAGHSVAILTNWWFTYVDSKDDRSASKAQYVERSAMTVMDKYSFDELPARLEELLKEPEMPAPQSIPPIAFYPLTS